ncbi:MAG: hypothetical protein AB1831_14520 [Pseudomonadota bacterium]
MSRPLDKRFSDAQLRQILEEAMVYMCACPAQVAQEILRLRELHDYQRNCLSSAGHVPGVHERIADSTVACHAEMEQCLEAVMRLEGWDMGRLTMPPGLRQRRDELIDKL